VAGVAVQQPGQELPGQPTQHQQEAGLGLDQVEGLAGGAGRRGDQRVGIDAGPDGKAVAPLRRQEAVARRHLTEDHADLGITGFGNRRRSTQQ
jgi:hypothetical protein